MENFFCNDNFYHDLESFIDRVVDNEECEIKDLPEDWHDQIEETTLEKTFKMDIEFAVNAILLQCDKWSDRLPEESKDTDEQIATAIRSSIDIPKLNCMIPSLYYPNGEKTVITKEDLILR